MSIDKKTYTAPRLAKHGSVGEITQLIQSGSPRGRGPGRPPPGHGGPPARGGNDAGNHGGPGTGPPGHYGRP